MTASRFRQQLTLSVPRDFDFWRTVYSHGWCALPPFSSNKSDRSLTRVVSLNGKKPILCTLFCDAKTIQVKMESGNRLTAGEKEEIARQLATCLRLNESFQEFHQTARRYPSYRWIANARAGRMLRAPTMFEDAVKMICTTNCTWGLTTLMVTNLVRSFGLSAPDGSKAFPTPEAIAGTSERFLRKEVKAGYRAPYILELAQKVASAKTDVEAWRSSEAPTEELFKDMRTVKGIGPYAAGNLLKLCGRYDYLGLDSWVRGKYYEIHSKGRAVKDNTIERHYQKYGTWRGLFFWLEMTRHFHDEKFSF